MTWRQLVLRACAALLLVLLSGCGLEADEQPTLIPSEAVPDDLKASPR
jgi:hypothetical protein